MFYLWKTITKKILVSPSLIIALVFTIFFLSFMPGSFVDPNNSIPGSPISAGDILLKTQIVASVIITGFLIVIMTSFYEAYIKLRRSLIYTTSILNGKPKWQFYFATFLPIFFLAIIFFVISIIFVLILDSTGVIAGSVFGNQKNIINWKETNWAILIVALIWTAFLGIAIALFVSELVKNFNLFISLIWGYLFLVFFFGGSSVPIFLIRGDLALEAFTYVSYAIPSVWDNFLFISDFSATFSFQDTIELLNFLIPLIGTITFALSAFALNYFRK